MIPLRGLKDARSERSLGLKLSVLAGVLSLAVASGCSSSPLTDSSTPRPSEARPGVSREVPADDPEQEVAAADQEYRSMSWLPGVVQRAIPFDDARRAQMAAYSERHYGDGEWRLVRPKLIVQHFAVAPDIDSIFNTFASNNPDPSYGELPNVCTHFAVDEDGRAVQFVSLNTRCRHVIGLNHLSIGIEHVGYSDADVLNNSGMLRGSLRLTQQLRCEFGIPIEGVIGHNESLSSPYFEEQVPEFQGQTHSDFTKESMDIYRGELKGLGPCT